MCNNYLQETAIKISIRFTFKTYNILKMIDMMVHIKCGLLLKVIISVFYSLYIYIYIYIYIFQTKNNSTRKKNIVKEK